MKVGSRRKVHYTVQVLDRNESVRVSERVQTGTKTYTCGQRNLGNGFFEDKTCSEPVYETRYRTEVRPIYRDDPVYATWYIYKIDRWVHDHYEKSHGKDQNPHWPEFTLRSRTRTGSRSERYQVVFIDGEGKRYEKDYSQSEWSGLKSTATYIGAFNAFGLLREVKLSK